MNHPTALLWVVATLLLSGTTLFSQTTVSGFVYDNEQSPLSYAGVMLLNASDSLLVKGAVSEDDGAFEFEDVPSGNYLLGISLIGYDDLFSSTFEITASESNRDLGAFQMESGALQLEEVEVVAKKPLFEQRIDRLVVNVAQSVTAAGSTALEVLERSPGIIVNRQSNSIAIAGKSGVVVMINNKINRLPMETLIQMLDGMPADNVERIEIITTPPANFDAEGNAGILSIILKKNLDEGLNGNFNASAGYGANEKYGSNINFNYRRGKVNVYGDYGYNFNHTAQLFTNYRSVLNEGVLLENDNSSERDPTTASQNARLGVDFQLSDQTVLGILGTWSQRHWRMDAINTVNRFTDGQLSDQLIVDNRETNLWGSWLGNINLQHEFKAGGRLTFDIDYAHYQNSNPTDYVNSYFDPNGNLTSEEELRVGKTTPIDIYVGKLDYSRELAEGITLEAGVKGTLSEFNNDFSVEDLIDGEWVSDPEFTAEFTLEEKIGAAYTSLSWQISPKTGAKAGLRYEYTDSNLGTLTEPNIVDREYGNLFPSLFLSRDLTDGQQLQLSYSRRINRPAYTNLAPFVIFLDPNTLMTGNVALQPAYSNNFSLGYRIQTWFISLNYGYTDDAISGFQPQVDPETNQQVNAAVNMDYQQDVGLSVSFPLQITSWWSMRNNLVGFWQENQFTFGDETVSLDGATFRGNTTQTLQLPGDINLEISGFFMSPVAFGLVRSKPFGDIAIGLQKQISERSSLRLNATNLLEGNWESEANQPEINLNYRGLFGFAERRIRLTYSYNFGNTGVKAARNRQTGSADEQGRVNN
ncbi:MAG: TonB-dependent receptor [Bacteroidota bacterium]